ncbi:MAG: glycine cleavage system protein GcvH [Anaerolineae bacterium]|nr:glycine cleavage system protein GcvH [Anaerolineae bacterium]
MGEWKTPDDCKYTRTDEWIRVEGDEAVIGITDYAQDQLSDLVYVDLDDSEIGASIARGSAFAEVESVKATSEVAAPASGEVIAVNEQLSDTPETINEDPYGEGWLVRIRLSDPSELSDLMDAAAYEAYCAGRE